MPTKQVTVDLIPCAVQIHAEPGDHLMLLGGVCVGVSTERAERPVVYRTKQNGAAAPPPQQRLPQKRAGKNTVDTVRARVAEAFAQVTEPTGTAAIADSLGVAGNDSLGRGQVRRAVAGLVGSGKLRKVSGERNDSKYELVPGPAQAGGPR